MPDDEVGDFCLALRFAPNSERPERIFRALTELIDACHGLDNTLAGSIGANVRPALLLQRVSEGSIRVWLVTALESLDDEALKELNWKKGVGAYLVKAKYRAIEFIKGRRKISSRAELQALQSDLRRLAADSDVAHLPSYEPVSLVKLLRDFEAVESGLSHLTASEAAFYEARGERVEINREISR